jgi:hypothetical protein
MSIRDCGIKEYSIVSKIYVLYRQKFYRLSFEYTFDYADD